MSDTRQRSATIDFLRGLCLLAMTTNHLPRNPFEAFTWQTFGFISAAEGFVFLSGLVAGRVYGRVAVTRGISASTMRTLKRTLVIYVANVLLITFGIAVAKWSMAELGDGFQPSWWLWLKTVLFLAAPGYSEILRMYCVFFLFLPVIFWALLRKHFGYVAAVSGALWLIAWLGYGMVHLPETVGYFDPLSWQVLFVVGIYLGFTLLREQNELRMPAWLTAGCFVLVAVFFIMRHWHVLTGQPLSPYVHWLSSYRRTLTLTRMVDFAAFALLLYRFQKPLDVLVNTLPGRAVAFLGRHSLQVFGWSVCVCMVIAKFAPRWEGVSRFDEAILTLVVAASCFLPAGIHHCWQRWKREKGSLPSPTQPLTSYRAVGR